MPVTANSLMSFAEFERLPDPPGARLELRHGVPVEVPPPFHGHKLIQRNLRLTLDSRLGEFGVVEDEVGFRPTPEHEYRIADVAFVSKERWEGIPSRGYLQGAPELVIEVLSDSNTASEMLEKQTLCLANGSREFWVVDPARREVKVFTSAGTFSTYTAGEKIPLLFNGDLLVDLIFG